MDIDLISHEGKDLRRFQSTTNFLVGLCRDLAEEMSTRCWPGYRFTITAITFSSICPEVGRFNPSEGFSCRGPDEEGSIPRADPRRPTSRRTRHIRIRASQLRGSHRCTSHQWRMTPNARSLDSERVCIALLARNDRCKRPLVGCALSPVAGSNEVSLRDQISSACHSERPSAAGLAIPVVGIARTGVEEPCVSGFCTMKCSTSVIPSDRPLRG